MNAKTLKLLLVATLVVVAGAFAARRFGSSAGRAPELPEHIAAGLSDRLNDVAAIEIASKGKVLDLARKGDDWVVASSAGYPAKFEAVKQILVALADLKPRERKTADPSLYARIGLDEPAEASDAVAVTLRDASGGEVAKLILGNEVAEGGASQRYVRLASDPQSWLAEGRTNPSIDPLQWMDRDLMRVPRDRITRVTITHPDGEVVQIEREQGGTNYTLTNPPEGRSPKGAGEIGAPSSALAYLRFDDVRKADDPGFEPGEPTKAVYETGDGLRVTVTTWKVDDKTWAAFAAESVVPPPESSAPPADGGDAAPATPEGGQPGASEPPATEKEAADLNARLAGWLYQIPEYQAASFRKHLSDLTEEAKPASPPGAGAPAPGDEDAPLFVPTIDAKDPDPGG